MNAPHTHLQFLGMTCGSLAELETQLVLAIRLGYLRLDAQSVAQSSQVGKRVRTLRKSRRALLMTDH
jgi:four helix bundle protein